MARPRTLTRLRRLLGRLPLAGGPDLPRTGGYPVARRPAPTAPRPRVTRSLVLALAVGLAAPTLAVAAASRPAGAEPAGSVTTPPGTLADGATGMVEVAA